MKLFGIEFDFGRRPPREMVCFGCGGHEDAVSKLIAGPHVFICDECVDAATEVLASGEDGPRPGSPMVRTEGRRCSFCVLSASVRDGQDSSAIAISGACIDASRSRLSVRR